jgi:hypothetical protein
MRKMIATAATLVLAGAAHANTMWIIENSTDTVWTIDVVNLTANQVGDLNTDWGFGGLGYYNKTMYGYNTGDGGLYTIDMGNGNATFIGADGAPFGLDGFDVNPVTGQGIGLGVAGETWDIDLATGDATLIAGGGNVTGIATAFDASGTLYEFNRTSDVLGIVDINTANVTPVGGFGVDFNGTSAAINPVDGFGYAFASFDDPTLWQIDLATGAATPLGVVANLPSQGVQYTAATFIPAPGSLALLGLGGLIARRRR